ncbi:hypothetical protein Vqi01_46520 [Micromonospora qiuiae]|uniref:Uncharacterized protein n=1 Tax=Micromonospora qiuiae TaxID=502268 RepID=A0ABQ4JJ45_9ACTN|nr:hypothetical protein Vqi01_46520 [Micromonospora qiuiae]
MPRSSLAPEERFGIIRPVLVDARHKITTAIETVHPAVAECLLVPASGIRGEAAGGHSDPWLSFGGPPRPGSRQP